MPRTKRGKTREGKGAKESMMSSTRSLGGFDDYEDMDPVYKLDTSLAKPTLSTTVAKSNMSYYRMAKEKYHKPRFDENDKDLWYKDFRDCSRRGVDPYGTVNWSQSTLISKSKKQSFGVTKKKLQRSDWLYTEDPTQLAHNTLKGAPKPEAPAKWGVSKTVALADKVLRSPQKYSSSFSGERFTNHKKKDEYKSRLGPGVYETNRSSLRVKESGYRSPTMRSSVPRFAAFGSTTNTKGYNKRKGWSEKYMKERFRFHL